MYRVIVLRLCAHVIIVCVIVLFTCFCIFVFLYFDIMCMDVSLMREAGYIRPLSCVNWWHQSSTVF
jgi:hypothetical protein